MSVLVWCRVCHTKFEASSDDNRRGRWSICPNCRGAAAGDNRHFGNVQPSARVVAVAHGSDDTGTEGAR